MEGPLIGGGAMKKDCMGGGPCHLFRLWCIRLLLLFVAGCLPAAATAAESPPFHELLATAEQLQALRDGGYVLYLRHGHTDNSQPDRLPGVKLDDCSTQRPLSAAGRKAAAEVGEAVRRARIPLGDIHVSPLCRTRESAEAAFGPGYQVELRLMHLAYMTPGEKAATLEATRVLLSKPVPAGRNRVIVAHGPNLMDLIGYFPKEVTLVIFRPLDRGAFEYVASIPLPRWEALLH